MAVKIRLKRMGKKKAPHYRIIVADSRSPRDGRFIDEIGIYDPNQEPGFIQVDTEAAKKWISNGAQPTDVIVRLFKEAGVLEEVGAAKFVREHKPAPKKEEPAAEETPAAEAPAEEAPAEEAPAEEAPAEEAPAEEAPVEEAPAEEAPAEETEA